MSTVEKDAIVTEKLAGARFNVKLVENDRVVIAYSSGRMRQRFVKIHPGDRVKVEVVPYSLDKARIVYRYKNKK